MDWLLNKQWDMQMMYIKATLQIYDDKIMIRSCKNLPNTSVKLTPFAFPLGSSELSDFSMIGLALVINACKSAAISPVMPLRTRSANDVDALACERCSFPSIFSSSAPQSTVIDSLPWIVEDSKSGFNNHMANCVTAYVKTVSRFRLAVSTPCRTSSPGSPDRVGIASIGRILCPAGRLTRSRRTSTVQFPSSSRVPIDAGSPG